LEARQDIDCILHCHSVYATTLAVHHKTIPAFHYMVGVAGGATIRCSRYATFGTQALSDAALEALADRPLSRLYVQALPLGDPPILDDAEMARVIEQMRRMSYGQAPDLAGVNDIARPRG
jgi:L-fuculose-phosphate aldolase